MPASILFPANCIPQARQKLLSGSGSGKQTAHGGGCKLLECCNIESILQRSVYPRWRALVARNTQVGLLQSFWRSCRCVSSFFIVIIFGSKRNDESARLLITDLKPAMSHHHCM